MRIKYLLATLIVGVVAAASLGVAVALTIREAGGAVVTGPTRDAGRGTAGDPAPEAGGRTTGGTSRRTGGDGAGGNDQGEPEKLSQPDLIAKVTPSVVHLAGSSGSGSGVVVDDDRGLVLTNAHVTAGQQGMRARVGDDPASESAARLVAAAPSDDLAVVQLVNKPADLLAGRSQANLGWELYPRSQVDLPEVFAADPDLAGQGGAAFGQQVTERLDQEGVDGLYVWDTEAGSPAEAGNLGHGDLVTSIDGAPVRTVQDVCDLVLSKRPGESVVVGGVYLNSAADAAEVLTTWETEVAVG
jgi:S1-C subfamily serine protease